MISASVNGDSKVRPPTPPRDSKKQKKMFDVRMVGLRVAGHVTNYCSRDVQYSGVARGAMGAVRPGKHF